MIGTMAIGELAQHLTVSLVALVAFVVIVRRVFGVFETRPAGQASAGGGAGPACSHCASGNAAMKRASVPRR